MKLFKILLVLSFWVVLLSFMIPKFGILVTFFTIIGVIVVMGFLWAWFDRDLSSENPVGEVER